MKVSEKLKEMLFSNGLFENQAEEIIDYARQENELIAGVLGKQWEGYPEAFHAVLWLEVRRRAVECIDEKWPDHWAR